MPLRQDCGFAHSEQQKAAYMKLYLASVGCPDLPDCRDKTCPHAHARAEQEGTLRGLCFLFFSSISVVRYAKDTRDKPL